MLTITNLYTWKVQDPVVSVVIAENNEDHWIEIHFHETEWDLWGYLKCAGVYTEALALAAYCTSVLEAGVITHRDVENFLLEECTLAQDMIQQHGFPHFTTSFKEEPSDEPSDSD